MSVLFDHLRARFPAEICQTLDFAWDQWRYTDYFVYDTDDSAAPFLVLGPRACRGFCTAVADYIAARFWPFADTQEAVAYLDCAWASQSVEGICDYALLHHDDWSGPVRGPLRAAMLVVNETMYEGREDGDLAARCVWIEQLARHLIPPALGPAFEAWRSEGLGRLYRNWPRIAHRGGLFADDFDTGPPVAPCTFLPADPATPAAAEHCLDAHMRRLDPLNPWRITPDAEGHGHSH